MKSSETMRSTSSENGSDNGPHPMRSVMRPIKCQQARQSLLLDMLEELDEKSSSSLFRHLNSCRSCLQAYIALQAAGSLAGLGPERR